LIKEKLKKTILYRAYVQLKYKEFKFLYPYIMNKKEVNEYLFKKLQDDNPFMACKLGSAELKVVNRYLHKKPFEASLKNAISNNAGFFPPTNENLKQMAKIYLEYLKIVDFMGIWFNKGELEIVKKFNPKIGMTGDYHSPYFCETPWSKALENKRVLVIHPFEKSIQNQYKKRELLFENKNILPKFELITLKAVQSIGGYHPDFESWFDALRYMQDEIIKINFDIALIGAGAYSLPLAGFCKELGKKALHLGGATQLLFGIYGKRWEEKYIWKKHINNYWKRPYEFEKPKKFKSVENGCYW